jgi:antitoxin component YwqK of YwqJK toxin-antitoxin module
MAIQKGKRICWSNSNTIHSCYDTPCCCITYSNYIEVEPLDINKKVYIIYRYDGNKMVLKCICHDEKIHDIIHYYTNGRIALHENFVNGNCGKIIRYYENGKILEIRNFKDGKLHGEKITYYENGSIQHKCSYTNNKLNGKRIVYSKNGRILTEEYFDNGISRNIK